jgi:hypothetical protein
MEREIRQIHLALFIRAFNSVVGQWAFSKYFMNSLGNFHINQSSSHFSEIVESPWTLAQLQQHGNRMIPNTARTEADKGKAVVHLVAWRGWPTKDALDPDEFSFFFFRCRARKSSGRFKPISGAIRSPSMKQQINFVGGWNVPGIPLSEEHEFEKDSRRARST